jgi:hypothetical protein
MAATVDIGDSVVSPPSSSGHGQEKRGGMGMGNGQQQRVMNGQQQQHQQRVMNAQQRSMGDGKQRPMGNGQQTMMNGQQTMMNGMDRGQLGQQQGMGARQLGQRMGSQQLGNGMGYQQQQQQLENGTGHQRSMNGMGHQPSHHPQNGIHAQNEVQGHSFVLTHQQQNIGVDPRQQPQAPQKLSAPGPPISFHYPPQDPHGTPRTRTISTGSIRPDIQLFEKLGDRLPQKPPRGKKLSKTRNGPDRSSTTTLHTNDGSNGSLSSSMQHKFVGQRSPLKSGASQVQVQQAQAPLRPTTPQKPGRPTTPQKSGRPTTPSTHKTVRPTTPQTQKSARPTTPANRPTTPPVVQLDEDTIRNAGIELDDDPFARVEGVRMLKPAMKKGKVQNEADDGETADGHGQGHEEVESASSHHHHHQREAAGSVIVSPEDAKRARKEARRLEREREKGKEREKEKERMSEIGMDGSQEHEEAEEPVSSYYFNLAQLLSHHQVVKNLLEYMNFYEWCILSSISKEIRILLVQSPPLREEVLERFLKTVGYGRWGWNEPEPLSLSLQVCIRITI